MELEQLKNLANLLDNKFEVLGIKFGIDPIVGLIPGGDMIGLLLGLLIIKHGYEKKISKKGMTKMIINTVVDLLAGIIPVVGDVADFGIKSNIANIRIIEEEIRLRTNGVVVEEGVVLE